MNLIRLANIQNYKYLQVLLLSYFKLSVIHTKETFIKKLQSNYWRPEIILLSRQISDIIA